MATKKLYLVKYCAENFTDIDVGIFSSLKTAQKAAIHYAKRNGVSGRSFLAYVWNLDGGGGGRYKRLDTQP